MSEIREISFPEKDLPLRDDISTLGHMLGEVLVDLHGASLLEQVEHVRKMAIRRREGATDDLPEFNDYLFDMPVEEARMVIRAFSSYLRLANLAEKVHRIRRRRDYLRNSETEQKGSFEEIFRQLRQEGVSAETLQEELNELQILPVFTAHPTEATRRTILEKEYSIIHRLVERLSSDLTPEEQGQALSRIRDSVTSAWQTRSIAGFRPTVADELDNILFYLTEIIYRIVPPFIESLQSALSDHYGDKVRLPQGRPVLQFGSWVGADMDGNPNVTSTTIRSTLALQRAAIIRCYLPELKRLSRYLSQTVGEAGFSEALMNQLPAYLEEMPQLQDTVSEREIDMPYRRLLKIMILRLRATVAGEEVEYQSAAEFVYDIELIAQSLQANKGENAGLFGVRRLLLRAKAFGFHLATLDARQDSLLHRGVVGELLRDSDWGSRPTEQRSQTIAGTLATGELPDLTQIQGLSGEAENTLEVFRALEESRLRYGDDSIGLFIISMTQAADDVLTVLLLARTAVENRTEPLCMDIAPLLETVDDLNAGVEILESLLKEPVYREHLESRGNRQFIMVGYSDSNKDSGIVAARWALQQAQSRLKERSLSFGIKLVFFHGRGGTVSRGGGNLVNGITGAPAGTVGGYLRVTEQGEVINQKYGIRPLAVRNLELATGAALQHGLLDIGQLPTPGMMEIMNGMATVGRQAFRALVYENPDFIPFFRSATPVDVIERLEIGSRPASRRSGEGIENMRAIPWVFSWAQTRIGLPGVYGIGTALNHCVAEIGIEELQTMYQRWGFFRGMVSDVEMVLAKSDLDIGRRYANLAPTKVRHVFDLISEEFDLAEMTILAIRQGSSLLDDQRTLKRNIRLRNPYVDPLHIFQINLLRRWREQGSENPELLQALKDSVNGIALGIQNTG